MNEISSPTDPRIQIRTVRLSGWRAAATVAVGLAILLAVAAFLALGFLFVVVPTVIIGAVAYYLLPKPARRSLKDSNAPGPMGNPTVIDATYRVANDAGEDGGRSPE